MKKILPDYIPAEGIFFFFFKIGNSMYSVEYFTNVPKNFGYQKYMCILAASPRRRGLTVACGSAYLNSRFATDLTTVASRLWLYLFNKIG